MANFLKYGDLVVFYHSTDDKMARPISRITYKTLEKTGGILSAFGYVDSGLYFQQHPSHVDPSDISMRTNRARQSFSGLHEGVFKITPRLNFDTHKEFKKTMDYSREVEEAEKIAISPEERANLKSIKEGLLEKSEKLQERLKKEQLLNASILRESLGTSVNYGSEIQLMHLNSNTFIAASKQSSRTDSIGYNIFLSDWFSASMVFKIQPRYKSRQEGDSIQINDYLLIFNPLRDGFIDICDSNEEEINDDRFSGRPANPFCVDVQVVEPKSPRVKAYLSQEPRAAFQVVLYRTYKENPQSEMIKGGDLVRICHTEINAELTADISYGSLDQVEVYFREYQGSFKEESVSVSSYFYLEHEELDKAGEGFLLPTHDSETHAQAKILLRHFLTNRLIVLSPDLEMDSNDLVLSQSLVDQTGSMCAFFEPVVRRSPELANNQTVFIREASTGGYLRYNKNKTLLRDPDLLLPHLKSQDPEYDFVPLNEGDLNEIRYQATLAREFSSENAYQISKVSMNEKNECFYLRSALPLLKFVAQFFKTTNVAQLETKREIFGKLERSLYMIICFLFDKEDSGNIDVFEIDEDPLPRRQKMFRDNGTIVALIDVVYNAFRYGVVTWDILPYWTDVREVLRLAQTTLRYAIKEYRPNELYLSQWIDLITEQSIQLYQHSEIYAGRTLIELIDNNKRILETRISHKTIMTFVGFLTDNRDAHFVDILRVLCICDKQPMIRNQREIAELLLNDQTTRERLLFELTADEYDGVLFKFGNIEMLPLQNLQGHIDDGGKLFKYVVVMIRLLADLCKGRNYVAIDVLQSDLPFEVCFVVMSNENYPRLLREAFCSLISSLWVDVAPFQMIELPTKIKVWDESKIKPTKLFEDKKIGQFSGLRKYILDYLRDIRRETAFEMKQVQTQSDEKSENRWCLDLAILTLTGQLLRLGIFREMGEVNQILTYLKNYLSSEKLQKNKSFGPGKTFSKSNTLFNTATKLTANPVQVQSQEEENFEEIQVPMLLAECKRKVCEILEFGLLQSNELRINFYLQSFRSSIEKLDYQVLYLLDQIIDKSDENMEVNTPQANSVVEIFLGGTGKEHRSKLTKMMDDLFIKVTSEGTTISIDKEPSLLSALVGLLLYKDPKIKLAAISLLQMLHNQRKQLGMAILDLQIIDDESSLEHYERAKEYCLAINTLADTIEKWSQEPGGSEMSSLAMILNKIYRSLLSIQRKNSPDGNERALIPEILNIANKLNEIKDMKYLGDTLQTVEKITPAGKSGALSPMARMSIDISAMYGGRRAKVSATYLDLKNQMNLTDIHQYHLDSEMENIDPFEQDLFRNSGIYEGLLKVIQFDVECLDGTRNEEFIHILRKIYRIFAKSSKDSLQNKHYLTKYLEPVIFKHFQESSIDLNASFLVMELIEGNKLILLDEEKVTWVVDQVCKINSNLDSNDIRKPFHFCILQRVLHYKNLILRNNQNVVLSKLVSKDYPKLLISFEQNNSTRISMINGLSIPLNSHIAKIGIKEVLVLPHIICFAISCLNLLSACAEEKNPFAETVCQSLLSMETIASMLGFPLICMPLKNSIVRFLYYAHLDHDREVPYHMVEVFLKTFEKLVDEYKYCMEKDYLNLFEGIDMEILMVVTHEAYSSWVNMIDEYMEIIVDCFLNIVKRNLALVFDSEPAQNFLKNQSNIIKISNSERMSRNSKNLEKKIQELIRTIYIRNRGHIELRDFQKEDTRFGGDSKAIKDVNISQARVAMLRSSKVKTNIGSRMSLFKTIELLIDFYFNDSEFKTKSQEEFYDLVINLSQNERPSLYGKIKADWTKVASSISGFVQMSLEDPLQHSKLPFILLMCVKVFRNYIEGEKVTITAQEPPFIFPEEIWNVNKPSIIVRQEHLCNQGIFELVCNIITKSDDLNLIREAFLLSLALLWGGNSHAQTAFLNFVKNDSENMLLLKLRALMQSSFNVVQKNMNEQNSLWSREYMMNQDPALSLKQDFEKEGERDKLLQKIRNEVEDYEMNQVLCMSIFKFLHLLCEGHNNDVQNILRVQPGLNSGSVNLVASSVNLWGCFVKFANASCVQVGEIMLDFLIESMQGPCEGNQMDLYSNKLIEYCKDFMSDFMVERDYEVRGFDHKSYVELDSLILKTIKALQAMVEANSHKEIYMIMGTHIEINYLMEKLAVHFADIFGEILVDSQTTLQQADITELNKKVQGTIFDNKFSEAFDLFFFLRTINDHTDQYRKKLDDLHGVDALIYSFFDHHSAHIEIIFKNELQKIYFVIHPACKFLEDDEKKKFLDTAKRDTSMEKMNDFIQESPKFFDRIDQMANLRNKCSWVSENIFVKSRNLCFLVTLAINLYMFLTLDKEVRGNIMVPKQDTLRRVLLKVLGIIHSILSIWTAFTWLVLQGPLVLVDRWRNKLIEIKKLTLAVEETPENRVERQEVLLLLEKNSSDLKREELHSLLKYKAKIQNKSFELGNWEITANNIIFFLSHKYLVYFSFYITTSFVALLLDIKILYALHLFDLIVISISPEHVRHSQKHHQGNHQKLPTAPSDSLLSSYPSLLLRSLRLPVHR